MSALIFMVMICYPGVHCIQVSPQQFSSLERCQEYLPLLAQRNEDLYESQYRPAGGQYDCVQLEAPKHAPVVNGPMLILPLK